MKFGFILDRFEIQSPGQQLLDRFLIGYNTAGEFRKPEGQTTVHVREGADSRMLRQREADFGLKVVDSLESLLQGSDALIVASGSKANTGPIPLGRIMNHVPAGCRVYIDSALIGNGANLEQLEELARARSALLASSSSAAHFFPLPVKPEFRPRDVSKALIVAHGNFPDAEREALFAFAPYFEYSGFTLQAATKLVGDGVWREAYGSAWRELFASAISRSNTIQGDPEKDGRTQDIVGLQLVEKLARSPRGWHLRHAGGLDILLLVLDGAVGDFNLAVAVPGQIHSAQLFRAPAPLEDHYSGLAHWIAQFFNASKPEDHLAAFRYVRAALDRMQTA